MSQIMWAIKDKNTGMFIKAYLSRNLARLYKWPHETVVKVEVKRVKEKK